MNHAHTLHGHPGHPATPSLANRVLGLAQRAWAAYWARKAHQTTALILHSLDDRTLKDIGIDRSEIESVVYTDARGRRSRTDRSVKRLVM